MKRFSYLNRAQKLNELNGQDKMIVVVRKMTKGNSWIVEGRGTNILNTTNWIEYTDNVTRAIHELQRDSDDEHAGLWWAGLLINL